MRLPWDFEITCMHDEKYLKYVCDLDTVLG